MTTLTQTIHDLEIGPGLVSGNLTMFPLRGPALREPDYLTLDEALAGPARITEVDAAGSVPELRFENGGDLAVLLMDGEELVGAKQNRVLNATILAPAGKTLIIPVSCVEQGRWSARSAAFAAAPRAQYATGRAEKMASVSRSLLRTRSYESDQGEVWRGIEEMSARLEAPSQTRAMSDIFERRRDGVEAFVRDLGAQEGQVGAVFAVNGAVLGLDLFDSASCCRSWSAATPSTPSRPPGSRLRRPRATRPPSSWRRWPPPPRSGSPAWARASRSACPERG
jgi:hypothetical protein